MDLFFGLSSGGGGSWFIFRRKNFCFSLKLIFIVPCPSFFTPTAFAAYLDNRKFALACGKIDIEFLQTLQNFIKFNITARI